MNTFIRILENALHPFRVIWAYFGRFLKLGGKRFQLTVAGKFALLYFLCFAIFITVILVLEIWSVGGQYLKADPLGADWPDWLNFVLYYLIALITSIAVYWGIRFATRERPSLYPEIDQCWEPIEKWRDKNNLDWHEFHRYLVLGPDLEVSKAMHAEMKDKKVSGVPSGVNDWMHWFGTPQSLYLHLKKVSGVSARLAKVSAGGKRATIDPANTLQASVGVPDWSASIGIDDDVGINDVTAEVDSSFGASMGGFGASLDPSESIDSLESGSFGADDLKEKSAKDKTDEMDEELGEDGDTPLERVNYLCKMIQSKTEGQMPFNGVLVVIPFDKFMTGQNFKTISDAVKKDLLEIRRQSDIAFPVSFVFASMEKDQGFPKLQNLLGTQRSTTGRFGAGCKVSDIPQINKKNLELQIERACISFEDWVINRWGKSSQLSRAAQNKELYKMIIRIRQQFRPHLTHLMEHALLWNESENPNGEEYDLTLAGCYFVSTGAHASERGFLNGVFLKCEEFAETASWGERIANRDRVYSVMGSLLLLAAFAVIIGTGIFLYLNG